MLRVTISRGQEVTIIRCTGLGKDIMAILLESAAKQILHSPSPPRSRPSIARVSISQC